MAPEQIEGHPRAASDQYALAVVVYEWLCGKRPFEGSMTEVMIQHLSMPPQSLRERVPTIPAEVEQVVLKALAKEPKERFASVTAFAAALEQASQHAVSSTVRLSTEEPTPSPSAPSAFATVAVPSNQPVLLKETPPELALAADASQPRDLATPPSQAGEMTPAPDHRLLPSASSTPVPADVPLSPKPTRPVQRKELARRTAALLIGLVVLVVAGGILGSTSLLAHFGVFGTRSGVPTATVIRGGTWTYDFFIDPPSFIPNASNGTYAILVDQALYLPLFYGDAQGVIHAGAASELPTVQNGGISTDAKTWIFHLRPHLVWSDGQPYDARDVDFTWRLWTDPKFAAGSTLGFNLISSADVSADHLSITFHLKRAYAPFLAQWVDGVFAPLPAHHFSAMAPQAIYKSPDNLNPKVVSGPFMIRESVPGDHYTLVRNPRYYRVSEGLPYLDKIIFRIVEQDTILKDLQAGSIDSTWLFWDVSEVQAFQRLYTPVSPPTSSGFEGMFFNFHNVVLATHQEVRQAIAMAIDHQALIQLARHGFASSLCTDHGSAYHPGYQPDAPCPVFDPATANKLLDDNGWVKGPDGVRAKRNQRLEFEYSTTANSPWRINTEAIIQHNLSAIGIKLDIQNYPPDTFFPLMFGGKASPPTGAVAGRYDIAEFQVNFGYDPDDSLGGACGQFPPQGFNVDFYCNHTLDALYEQEQASADPGVRQQLFEQIHQIYLADFPFIVLYSPLDIYLVRKGTHNYLPSPIEGGTINIWEWWCDKGKC